MRGFFVLFFVTLCLLWGCSGQDQNSSRTDKVAQLIADEKYQEAYDLMVSYKDTLTDEKEKHLEMLQWVMVNDKLFHPIRHDSIVKKLLNYYIDDNNSPELHPLVYYYTGRTYIEMLKDQLALKYLYKVFETADKEKDWDIVARTHAQIGSIFMLANLFSLAKSHFSEEYKIELAHGDLKVANDTKSYIALTYRGLGQPDSAVRIYKEMMEAPYFKESKENKELVISQYLALLVNDRQFAEAHKLLEDNNINRKSVSYPPLLHTLNKLEKREGKDESVKERSLALLTCEGLHRQRQAADNLSEIFLEEGNVKEALKYTRLLRSLSDSITIMEASAALSEMAAIHDVSEKEHENAMLKEENLVKTRRTYLLWAIIVSLLLLMGVIAWIFFASRAKKEKAHQKEMLEVSQALENKLIEINRYQKEINELKEEKINLDKVNSIEESSKRALAVSTVLCNLITKTRSHAASEEDFLTLEKVITDWDPNGMRKLKQLDLSARNFKDAMLIVGNIQPKVCAIILQLTPQAISNSRTRAFKNLAVETDAKDWVTFIKSLFTVNKESINGSKNIEEDAS